jgi:hypothetical protein
MGVLYPTVQEEIGEFETGKPFVDISRNAWDWKEFNVNGFLL